MRAVVILSLVTGACGTPPRAGEPSRTSTREEPSRASGTAGERVHLGMRDNGRTVRTSVGAVVLLSLPASTRWSQPEVDGVPADVDELVSDAPAGTQTWEVRPRAAGRLSLRVRGEQTCEGAGCSPSPTAFDVELDVGA